MTTKKRAAAIFIAAFNLIYDGDDWLTIGVDNGVGAEIHVTGWRKDRRIRFDPADVEMLLDFLARVLAKDTGLHAPYGVVSVQVPHGDGERKAWAWFLRNMSPLADDQAVSWLGGEVRYHDGLRLNPDRVTNPDATPITEPVKELLAARGLNGS